MKKNNFADLVETFAILRGPNGCPWDKKQTHESLIKCLQNESQELIDAINNKDDENMKEELGDVLLQVLMHSQIAAEEGKFTIDDVIQGSRHECRGSPCPVEGSQTQRTRREMRVTAGGCDFVERVWLN